MLIASPAFLPRIRSITKRAFCGETRTNLAFARVSICQLVRDLPVIWALKARRAGAAAGIEKGIAARAKPTTAPPLAGATRRRGGFGRRARAGRDRSRRRRLLGSDLDAVPLEGPRRRKLAELVT